MNRQQFDALTAPQGALLVGSPQEVIERYFTNMNFFNTPFSWHKKALVLFPHDKILHAIELLGTKVAPEVKKYIFNNNTKTVY